MRVLFVLLYFFTPQLFAQGTTSKAECSTVDASEHMGPVRDQGNSDWCFAFTAADLLSQQLKLDPKKRVSAYDMALQFYKADGKDIADTFDNVWAKKWAATFPEAARHNVRIHYEGLINHIYGNPRGQEVKDLSGGWSSISLLLTNKVGLCTEDNLPSEIPAAFAEHEDYLFHSLTRAQNKLQRENKKYPNGCSVLFPEAKHGIPLLTSLSHTLDVENKKILLNSLEDRCAKRMSFEPIMPVFYFGSSQENIAAIHRNLNDGNPTGIVYDEKKLFGREARVSNLRSNHESSIVGRRWNSKTKKCELKLRNSWGASWCPKKAFPANRCENGNIWLTAEELSPFVQATTTTNLNR